MVTRIQLNEGRKLIAANVLGPIAAFGERAARRQMRDVRRQAGDLVEFLALLVCRVGHAP